MSIQLLAGLNTQGRDCIVSQCLILFVSVPCSDLGTSRSPSLELPFPNITCSMLQAQPPLFYSFKLSLLSTLFVATAGNGSHQIIHTKMLMAEYKLQWAKNLVYLTHYISLVSRRCLNIERAQ